MKFYAEPNLLVRTRNVGVLRHIKQFRFDKNGEFETDNRHLIKALKPKFRHDEAITEVIEEVIEEFVEEFVEESVVESAKPESAQPTDEEIRSLAKESGIKSWHVKSIETLKLELGV